MDESGSQYDEEEYPEEASNVEEQEGNMQYTEQGSRQS